MKGVLFGLLMLVVPASAQAADWVICIEHDVDFVDAGSSYGDDYLTDDTTDMKAAGVWVAVRRKSGGLLKWSGYTADGGSESGCTPTLSLNLGTEYNIEVISKASIDGNIIEVLDDDSSNSTKSHVYVGWSAGTGGTLTVTTTQTDWWNIAAVAGWTAKRTLAWTSGETVTIFSDECPSSGLLNCNYGGNVYVADSTETRGAQNKVVIAHELGHAVMRIAAGTGAVQDRSDSGSTCDATEMSINSREYQSAAAVEGMANFLAAYAFNDESELDCYTRHWVGVDWDNDGTSGRQTYNCEGAPDPGELVTSTGDYVGDECSSPLGRRGTNFDWVRFWWDLTTNEEVEIEDSLSIWDEAGPGSWNTKDLGLWTNHPSYRLEDAADTLGFGTEWDAQDTFNGVHR